MTTRGKRKLKKIAAVSFILFLLAASAVNAQSSYTNAFGLRAGGSNGLTYKHQFGGGNAVELILLTSPGLTALYEKHMSTKAEGLMWYAGGGAHIRSIRQKAYWVGYHHRHGYRYYADDMYYGPALGVDLIAGLEYKFSKAPLALSLDIKPNIEFWREYTAMYLDPALGIKIAF